MATEKLIRDWYNRRHASKGEHSWRPYEAYPVFLDYLDAEAGKKLLDVGSGTGYLLKVADQRGLETFGVDISNEGVKIAKKVSPNSKIFVGTGEKLKFTDNFFDYVTCLGALEHFMNVEKGVREMVRVAKRGATLCIVVPNINYLFWISKKRKGTEQQDINENLSSLEQWKRLFLKGGCDIEEIRQDTWFMKRINIFSSKNPLGILKRLLFKLLWFSLPLKFTYQFVFILRKK